MLGKTYITLWIVKGWCAGMAGIAVSQNVSGLAGLFVYLLMLLIIVRQIGHA